MAGVVAEIGDEVKEWSRMMGWTGKDSKPRYRL